MIFIEIHFFGALLPEGARKSQCNFRGIISCSALNDNARLL